MRVARQGKDEVRCAVPWCHGAAARLCLPPLYPSMNAKESGTPKTVTFQRSTITRSTAPAATCSKAVAASTARKVDLRRHAWKRSTPQ